MELQLILTPSDACDFNNSWSSPGRPETGGEWQSNLLSVFLLQPKFKTASAWTPSQYLGRTVCDWIRDFKTLQVRILRGVCHREFKWKHDLRNEYRPIVRTNDFYFNWFFFFFFFSKIANRKEKNNGKIRQTISLEDQHHALW